MNRDQKTIPTVTLATFRVLPFKATGSWRSLIKESEIRTYGVTAFFRTGIHSMDARPPAREAVSN